MRVWTRALLSGILGLSLIASACGTSGGGSPSKGTVTIGAFSFSESAILAQIYGQALQHNGYTVHFKLNLGSRKIVAPALKHGDIDLYPGYSASDLEFRNNFKGQAGGDAAGNVTKLNTYLAPDNLVALSASPANDQNALAVLPSTASRYSLSKISDLASVANQLVFGGPPDWKTNPYGQPGLERVYGIHFKEVKALDFDGPITHTALQNNNIQVALIFSSDGIISVNHWVVLQDDKHLEAADNITPIGRKAVLSGSVADLLNRIDAALTTNDLVGMNKRADVDKADPSTIAGDWLKSHGFM